MSNPWEDFQDAKTTTEDEPPWKSFSKAESSPWEDFIDDAEPSRPTFPTLQGDIASGRVSLLERSKPIEPIATVGGEDGKDPLLKITPEMFATPQDKAFINQTMDNGGEFGLWNKPQLPQPVTDPIQESIRDLPTPYVQKQAGDNLVAAKRNEEDFLGSIALTPLIDYLPENIRREFELPTERNGRPINSAAGGVLQGLSGIAKSFTSPLGLATLNMSTLSKPVQRAVSLAFSADMARHTPELARQLGEEMGKNERDKNPTRIAQLITEGAANTIFATLAGKHGLSPRAKPVSAMTPFEKADFVRNNIAKIVQKNAEIITPKQQVINEVETALVKPNAEILPDATAALSDKASAPVIPEPVAPKVEAEIARADIEKMPVQELQANYETLQAEARKSMDAGQFNEAAKQLLQAQWHREALQNKTGEHFYEPKLQDTLNAPDATLAKLKEQGFSDAEISSMPKTVQEQMAASRKPVVETVEATPEMIGMGGAVPSEFERSFRTSTGIKKSAIEQVRAERGTEPADIKAGRERQDDVHARVTEKLDTDPEWPDRLVNELSAKPRTLNADEVLVLDTRYVDLQNEFRKAVDEGVQAADDGRGDAVIDAKRKADYWENKLGEFEQMARSTGTAWGRTGAMMQRMMKADFSLESMEKRARAAKDFEPLTPEEHVKVQKDFDAAQVKIKELEAREKTVIESAVKEALDKVSEEAKQPAYHPAILEAAERIVVGWEKRADLAAARLREKFSRVSSGVDPTIVLELAEIGMAKLGRKVVDFAKWADSVRQHVGLEFSDRIEPYLKDAYDASQKAIDADLLKVKGVTAEKVKRAVKNMDVTEQKADLAEKIKEKFAAGKLDDISPLVQRLALKFSQEGVKGWRPLADAVHGVLKEIVPGLDYRDTMLAISGHGRFKPLTKDAAKLELMDAKSQMNEVLKIQEVIRKEPVKPTGFKRKIPADATRQLTKIYNEMKRRFGINVTDPATQLRSALQARETYYANRISDLRHEIEVGKRTVRTKTPSPTSPKLEALQAELENVQAEHKSIFGDRTITPEQKLKMAIAAAERGAVEYQRRIDAGEFSGGKKPSAIFETPELKAARANRDAVKEQFNELRDLQNPKKTPEERALQSFKTRTTNRIAELTGRMARNDFAPKPKRPDVALDPEAFRLKGDLEKINESYQGMLEQWKFDQLGIFGKGRKIAGAAWDAMRNIMTTGEMSYVLRQGKAFVLSRPITASKAFVKSLRAFASERVARESELRIRNEPDYPASQEAKLHISREGDNLSKQEEMIMGRWGRAIPVVKSFNRAAVTFLNELRWESWSGMRKTLSSFGKSTKAEDVQYAMMANEATGRGGLGFAEPAAVTLGRAFFAPRYLVSRIQMALGHSMWGGTARSRAVIASEYSRILVGYFIYTNLVRFGLNALLPDDKKAKISFDPRSADFGKLVIGETRVDPMAGLAQLATFGGRTITGETKNAAGQVTAIRPHDGKKVPYGKSTWYDVAGRFLLSKTHPGISYVGNLFNGVDLIGNETSLASETGKLLGPITYIDIYKAMKAQGVSEGTAMAILAFLGEGLQTYKPKK